MFQHKHLRMSFHARMGIEKENLPKIDTNINRCLTSKSSSILISTMNAQSLGNKHLQILDYFIDCKIDIGIITEIWINDECPVLISDLNSQSYWFIPFTRTQRGGGIGMMYNKNIKIPRMEKQEYSTFELLTVRLCVSGKNISIHGVYHMPLSEQNKHTNQQFIDEFSEVMSLKIIESAEILILGHFNIAVNNPMDQDAQLLIAWLDSSNLHNIVDFPTHRSRNTLDLVIVRENQRISVTNIGPGDYISDHCEVSCRLNILKPSYTRVTKEFRSVKNLDIKKMGNDIDTLSEQIILSFDIEDLSIKYQEGLDSLVEKFMPLKKSVVLIHHKYPWFSEEISHLKKALRSLERRWCKDKTIENWTEYKNLRNIYNHRLRAAKRIKLSNMVNECGNDVGQLY